MYASVLCRSTFHFMCTHPRSILKLDVYYNEPKVTVRNSGAPAPVPGHSGFSWPGGVAVGGLPTSFVSTWFSIR